jgi:hypothetical protein
MEENRECSEIAICASWKSFIYSLDTRIVSSDRSCLELKRKVIRFTIVSHVSFQNVVNDLSSGVLS